MSSIKLISAADTQYAGSLLKTFSDQRSNGLFCDVTIIVQSRTFKAHRNILSASSTYFHQLFSVAGQIIELNFIKAEIFEVILSYIYSAKIIRVRSDMLEELIKCGRILGVKFIASLGRPLSQVKGLPNLSKDQAEGDVKSSENNTANALEKSDLISQELDSGAMPIITEAFSLSAEFKGDNNKNEGSDNDDVLFVSKKGPKKTRKSRGTKVSCTPSSVIDVDESSAEVDSVEKGADIPKTSSAAGKEESSIEKKDQNPMNEEVEEGKSSKLNSSSQGQPESQPYSTSYMEQVCPDTSTSMPHSPADSSSGNSLCSQPLPPQMDGSPKEPCEISFSKDNNKVIGVQKKRITTVLGASADKPGEFRIKLSDLGPPNSPEITMFEKDLEMDLISSGSKDSDEEDGYELVPMKDSLMVGGSKTKRGRKSLSSPNSPSSPPPGVGGKKKAKVGMDDHYELIMDGKTFYVCIVCKRPYVCLTSLRRHFNVHSWEKKYPCHYCDKVFPLAEYRTKHEIQHTGERRYQCLLCGAFFMNYQLLSSHCKQVHNEDPSGRKEKEYTDNNLYRLLPCKTLEIKSYSYMPEGKIPMINEEGIVYHMDPREGLTAGSDSPSPIHARTMNWDDIFVESGSQVRSETSVNCTEDTPEFEFVIPETY